MAVTAQLVGRTGLLPRGLRAFVEVGSVPGHDGNRVEAVTEGLRKGLIEM